MDGCRCGWFPGRWRRTRRDMGLRAGEVAAITLEDVDWRRGELLIHGKGGRDDVLPLPCDLGEALVSYLRRRGPSESRSCS